jgi:fibronectin-binding autotransporter adhesin
MMKRVSRSSIAAFLVSLFSLFLTLGAAYAATINVTTTTDELTDGLSGRPAPNGNCSLREAVQAANTNTAVDACTKGDAGADTIDIPSGFYLLSHTGTGDTANLTGDLNIKEDLTISGAGASSTIIDGGKVLLGSPDRILQIGGASSAPTVIISGVTLQNGNPGNVGGAIMVSKSPSVTLQDCEIANNEGTFGGGVSFTGVSLSLGSLTITRCDIHDNESVGSAGGVALDFGTTLTISDSNISHNTAASSGGGFWSGGQGAVTITNSTIDNNSADAPGGGAFFLTSTVTDLFLSGTSVSGNASADNGGGFVSSATGAITLSDVTIDDNHADGGVGGAFRLDDGTTLTISGNSSISRNVSSLSAGGFFTSTSGAISITGTHIDDNTANGGGCCGGFEIGSGTDLTIANTSISGNTSPSGRGGFESTVNGAIKITDSMIDDNTALSGKGGGFVNNVGTSLSISGGSVSRNSSTDDGGGFLTHVSGATTIDNVTIDDNASSGGDGGGFLNDKGASLSVTGSRIRKNTASGSGGGGGFYNTSTGPLAVTNSEIDLNAAQAGSGGGFNTFGTTTTITGSRISGNQSVGIFGGGGLIHNGSDTLLIDTSTIDGNQARGGGGLINLNLTTADTKIFRSTINHNIAVSTGGGVLHAGGSPTKLTITDSTISGNQAGLQGGGVVSSNAGFISSSTIVDNASPTGAAIYVNAGSVTVKNSIIANSALGNNCNTAISSDGYNIDSANSCGFVGPGDQINTDPKLGVLQDNGGGILTHDLLAGSPAIDKGDPAGCTDDNAVALTTDERGFARSTDGDQDGTVRCDIGAVELDSCGDLVVQAGEACDDGNADDTDGCLSTCQSASCGDGFVQAGVEECDNGAANSDNTADACRTDCKLARCGDGVTDTGEACDDGNADDTDACKNDCTLPAAGTTGGTTGGGGGGGGGGCSLIR